MNRLRIAIRADESKPQFFAAHYPRPNHTSKNYKGTKEELDDYRKAYQARSVMAARIMDRMLTKIRSADPTAIVLVFGDHGPYTKRGIGYDDDPEGMVQDHHGILGAVFGADECMPFYAAQSRRTNSDLRSGGDRPAPVSFGRNKPAAAGFRFWQDYPSTWPSLRRLCLRVRASVAMPLVRTPLSGARPPQGFMTFR